VSGEEFRVLAEEQAALRRVATLVARGSAPEEVFAAVTEEVARRFPTEVTVLYRYEPDGTFTVIGSVGSLVQHLPVGSRWPLEGENLTTRVLETARPARVENYAEATGRHVDHVRGDGIRSSVGAPIIVEGRVWGIMGVVTTRAEPLPADTEERLASFTELVATAIANAESRTGLARLAEEQAALRRVATLVARGVPPEDVFAAVAEEVGRVLPIEYQHLGRYEPDGMVNYVGARGGLMPAGTRLPLGGDNVTTRVFETGRAARTDYANPASPIGAMAMERSVRWSVGAPISVEGRLWGVMIVGSALEQPPPPDTEQRLTQFMELLATAIANTQARTELAASRARVVAAADETRRRIERDLHDGIQQELVSLILEIRAAETSGVDERAGQPARTARALEGVLEELREIAQGIHPAILSRGGLPRALTVLARRSVVPVKLDLHAEERLPEPVETAAYYATAEALTNAAKHAHASIVHVALEAHDEKVRLAIRDDGIGGADLSRGSGLIGLSDRIAAVGGTLTVTSPAGNGTTLLTEIPLEGPTGNGRVQG
jgi:signal transduction histidine kinase